MTRERFHPRVPVRSASSGKEATRDEHEDDFEERGVRMMRTYYWKVFRHLLSTAVLTGFLAGSN
jgi:hypothetical protein